MAQLSETFPTLDCSQCIMTPKMVDVANHPNITLYTYSEIELVEGYIGNFQVTIRKKARSVDEDKCTGCGVCMTKCPQKKIPNKFDQNLGMRTAIYVPFPQAVPNTPVIDRENCTKFKTGKCGVCQKVCGPGAVDYEQEDRLIVEAVGAIVVATGFDLYSIDEKPEGLPDQGVRRIRPRQDPRRHRRHDLRAAGLGLRPDRRQDPAPLRRQGAETGGLHPVRRHPGPGKGDLLLLQGLLHVHRQAHHALPPQGPRRPGLRLLHGRPHPRQGVRRILAPVASRKRRRSTSAAWSPGSTRRATRSSSWGATSPSASRWRSRRTWWSWPPPSSPRKGPILLAQKLGISYDKYNFYSEAHAKLRPVECATAGIYLAGACQGPKDIPDTVSQASAAAAKVMTLFSKDELEREPIVARVNEKQLRRLLLTARRSAPTAPWKRRRSGTGRGT